MDTFSALLALCAGNSPVNSEFPSQRPVTRSFDVCFDLYLNKRWVNNREAGDLRRIRPHYDVTVMNYDISPSQQETDTPRWSNYMVAFCKTPAIDTVTRCNEMCKCGLKQFLYHLWAESLWRNENMRLYLIPTHWYCTGSRNPFSRKTSTCTYSFT